MPNQELELLRLKREETENYFAYIMGQLENKEEISDYIYFIPFDYDDVMLDEICKKNNIDLTRICTSASGSFNPYLPNNKLIFKRKVRAK